MNRSKGFALVASAIAGVLLWGNGASTTDVQAAQTQLATVPVAGTGQAVPKPNVMLLMDTSRSMAFTHMPDELEFPGGNPSYEMPIGYRSAQCNALYYDPAKIYEVPRGADGYYLVNPPSNVDFGAARYDFYSAATTNTNLATSFRAYDRNTRQLQVANDAEDPAQPAYYYTYEGTQALRYDAAPCTDMESVRFAGANLTQANVTANTTGGLWRRKLVSSSSGTGAAGTDERRNFAIWYTFYRTRMAMVKSSISLAFNPINDGFRVGLVSMNPLRDTANADSGVNPTKYLAIDDFNDTHKSAWYAKLYGQTPEGSSPAREGLARVGRHYAGRTDGINAEMTPDPVRYSCQQNFTIMTTDGYWNTAQETRGPVGIDGTTRVGNQDGNLTPKTILDRFDPLLYSHRPIWDGTTSGSRTDTTTSSMNRYQPCTTGEFFRTSSVVSRSTSQPTQRVQSLTKTTEQVLASTVQTSRSTTQDRKTTSTQTRQSLQALASTQQQTRSTRQEMKTLEWWGRGTRKVYASTTQVLQTTSYMLKTVAQIQTRTRTQTMTQTRQWQTQQKTTKTTTQLQQSTSQSFKTDTLTRRSTTQPLVTRTYQLQSTRQEFQRTAQVLAYNGATETTTPVASCTNSGNITCLNLTNGPTAVASCTPQSPNSGNNYVTRTCDAPTLTGPTAVQTCTAQAAGSGNNYTSTTCAPQVNGPTAAASCSPAGPSAGNGWANVTCSSNTTGPTSVASCTPGTDANFVTTSCSVTPTTTAVAPNSCTPGTNASTQVVTTCNTQLTGPTGVASCTPTVPTSGNSYLTTSCATPVNNSFTATKAACVPASAGSGNAYTTTACNTVITSPRTAVASCTAAGGTSPNFIETFCDQPAEQIATNKPVDSCTASGATSANSFVRTTCGGATYSAWSNAASCTAQAPTSGNAYLERQCQELTTSTTQVLPAQCTAGTTGSGVKTTCTPTTFTDVPVSSCVPNTTGPSFVSCRTVTTPETLVASCTAGGNASTNWVITACRNEDTPEVNVGTCTPVAAGSGNGNTATTCNFHSETTSTAPGSCVAQTGNSGNNWVTIKCPAPVTTGPTGVPLNSCSPVAASSGNDWTATTCAMNGPTAATPVASCTGGTNATDFTVTTCTNNNSPVTNVMPGSCVAQTPTSGNGFTTVNCVSSNPVVGVAAGSCVPQTAASGNGFTQVSCNTVTTGPTFVAQGSCSAGTSANFTTTSCNTVNTGPTLVAACSNGVDANFKVTSCTVNTSQPQQLTPGTACTSEVPTSGNNFTRTTCTAVDTTVGVAADTCVPSPRGVLPVVSCAMATTNPTPVAACTPGTDASFLTTNCTSDTQGPDRVTSCSPVTPTADNGYRSTTCVAIPGTKVQRRTQTTIATYDVSGDTAIDSSVRDKSTTETDWTDATGICYASPASPPVVDVSGAWGGTTTAKGPVSGPAKLGSVDSLADVAQYYYINDLRPSMSNDTPRLGEGIEDDRAPWQHMTTFVVGLGVSGNLNYQENYKSATTGDFSKIRSYENTPVVNWPIWPNGTNLSQLQYNDPRSIDDFWHAAVNGRGKYFSARDPQSVVDGLKEALSGIKAQAGAGAGASLSSLTPTAGDNFAYTGSFTTLDWTGELLARDVDVTTGNLSTTVRWSARGLLDAKVSDECDNRKIYARDPANGSLVDFTWNTKACDATTGLPTGTAATGLTAAMQAAFTSTAITTGLSQYPFMSDGSSGTLDQRGITTGANLLNYLRGQRKREGYVYNTAKLYRARAHVLGDIVNSQPAYVKAPSQFFQDAGYDDFKTTYKARTPMVYVGANDGMLHAFYAPASSADTNYANAGQEAWAFVPQVVMPNMWTLADTNYPDKHQFFVDGSPISSDVYTGGQWKTMVVAGLGHGGNGYYALDVTNPASPRAMWEFNMSTACASNPIGATADCNVGLTYGRPIITKLRDGTWVVLVTSGYNNSVSGDGKGYLYVLNAGTGAIIQRIATSAGDSSTPSGLREINIFVNNYPLNNTAERAYGADLLGNVWRFDINNVIAPTGYEAALLATAKDKSNNPQPITTRPQLAEVNGITMVVVGTGRMLSTDDLTDTSAQTVYAFQDALTAANPSVYTNLRTELKGLALVQSGSGSSATRTVQCATTGEGVCLQTKGWYIDLPDNGERANVDMQTVYGTLVFASNVPSNTMCSGGGYSWLNYVDLITGLPVGSSTGGVTSRPFFSSSLVVGLAVVVRSDGTVVGLGTSDRDPPEVQPIPVGSPPPQGKRISWRELVR
ncbi:MULTISPECIES: PilC/PilY family type IV pilus protein [unclassified Variovorax]|uniref:PilC/PilY family type IV pilus protein n=1 Tax=unclassified Variovorax TaxID=663243 RepID=UPI003F472ACE